MSWEKQRGLYSKHFETLKALFIPAKEHKTHNTRSHPVPDLSRPGQELYVKKIRNGTVIDHISPGHALDVLKILGINGHEGNIVSIALNVASKKSSKKDIVKVEGRELKPNEVDKIALIAPEQPSTSSENTT